jgi:cytochrome c biogenesis protein CcdA
MDNYSPCEQTIKIMYFAFTTFSTVGLGDFNYLNTSDFEIIFGTGMLLMGFVIFIYIISQYISMINAFIDFNKEIGDGEKLSQFFKVCEKYNDNKPLNF